MSAITGLNGLDPTLKIIPYTNRIAIVNKEAIICGWNLIKSLKKIILNLYQSIQNISRYGMLLKKMTMQLKKFI